MTAPKLIGAGGGEPQTGVGTAELTCGLFGWVMLEL